MSVISLLNSGKKSVFRWFVTAWSTSKKLLRLAGLGLTSLVAGLRLIFATLTGNHHINKEFKAALFVASLTVIISYFHLFDDQQQDLLQYIYSLTSFALPETVENAEITTVMIDDYAYDTQFAQASPLDRSELQLLLGNILREGSLPCVLAIDLDLSPSPARAGLEKAEDTLYKFLIRWTAKLSEEKNRLTGNNQPCSPHPADENGSGNSSTAIVLITPQPVFDPELADQKLAWMERMCDAGIRFGLPDLASSGGLVTHYYDSSVTLAAVTRSLWEDSQFAHENSANDDTIPDSDSAGADICELDPNSKLTLLRLKNNPRTITLHDALYDELEMNMESLALINWSFPEYVRYEFANDYCNNCAKQNRPLSPVVVFGGQFGVYDYFGTPYGTMSGVKIHSGIIYTLDEENRINELSKLWVYFIELALGTASGLLFYGMAIQYRNTRSIFSIALNVLLPFIVLMVLLVFAAFLLQMTNLYISVAPIVTGMFLHAEIVRTSEPVIEINNEGRVFGVPENTIKMLVYWLVVIYAWILIAVSITGTY